MATLDELRSESVDLFTNMLRSPIAPTPGGVRALDRSRQRGARPGDDAPPAFSPFDAEDAEEASIFAMRLGAIARDADSEEDGLEAVLTEVRRQGEHGDLDFLHHALSLFVTHDEIGRRLRRPRTLLANPQLFARSTRSGPGAPRAAGGGSTGAEAAMDYWREDVLANEHHEHWHVVYPWSGLWPRSTAHWVAICTSIKTTARPGGLALFSAFDSATDWNAFFDSNTGVQIWDALRGLLIAAGDGLGAIIRDLPAEAYTLFRDLNDRQGEMFLYMHQQMLARYDAERLSLGMPSPVLLHPFDANIPEGYDPGNVLEAFGFRKRDADMTMLAGAVADLTPWHAAVEKVIEDGAFPGTNGGGSVVADVESLGQGVEAVDARFRTGIDNTDFPGIHNDGHMRLCRLSDNAPPTPMGDFAGVMRSPRVAIRDPVFWRWHGVIDKYYFDWQERLTPHDFADAPSVVVRPGADAWTSGDVILCRTTDLPGHDAPDFLTTGAPALGEAAFGGANWDTDFTSATVTLPDGTTFDTVSELRTWMDTRDIKMGLPGGAETTESVPFLNHEPFCLFVRIENPTNEDREVTIRMFLAPADRSENRRAWIEVEKLAQLIPANSKRVVFIADETTSVVKKPADKGPPESWAFDSDAGALCDCGWPYPLLLPRGTEAGMACHMAVICTDATLDRVQAPGTCGSMSYCGATDRYPDTREMGYPFARPFADTIANTFQGMDAGTGRSFSIRHVDPPVV